MQLGIVVNDIYTEWDDYTTTSLAMSATNLGHEVWYMGLADFTYDEDEQVHAAARSVPREHKFRSNHVYLETLRGKEARQERITLDSLDVLLLRNDPAEDVNTRPWARLAAINFARLAMRHGVIVLNDPNGLMRAINKMYLHYFPSHIWPETLISQDPEEIKDFIADHGDKAVLKPLSGSGGRNVFLAQPEDKPNLNQMIDAVKREGYVIVQEYLPEAIHGDTRVFLINGEPLRSKGRYAAFRRVRPEGDPDMRSNMTAGAKSAKTEVTDTMLEIAEIVRPKLVADGLFLVGLDIVGDKLMEINTFSPGGLISADHFEERDFPREIILAIERKVDFVHQHGRDFSNLELATK